MPSATTIRITAIVNMTPPVARRTLIGKVTGGPPLSDADRS
jgi:hypothetical protein